MTSRTACPIKLDHKMLAGWLAKYSLLWQEESHLPLLAVKNNEVRVKRNIDRNGKDYYGHLEIFARKNGREEGRRKREEQCFFYRGSK